MNQELRQDKIFRRTPVTTLEELDSLDVKEMVTRYAVNLLDRVYALGVTAS